MLTETCSVAHKPLDFESQKSYREVMPLPVRVPCANPSKTKFGHDSAFPRSRDRLLATVGCGKHPSVKHPNDNHPSVGPISKLVPDSIADFQDFRRGQKQIKAQGFF
ncbi:hypothetical protein Pla52o_15070 [Novipirellula galeiformis]|uniref:Uncharacterized protein n=1 Tax=Novipirellula galeiformis TaxID=2528004 RepID=A0A5C6CQT9_9BACT|nr:hypothetical protein Pla52o_15070 [Novipirellula galeiformis]